MRTPLRVARGRRPCAGLALVIEPAAASLVGRPFEAAVVYGCCEVGYIEDGEVEPGLTRFFADADHLPVHDDEYVVVRIAEWLGIVGAVLLHAVTEPGPKALRLRNRCGWVSREVVREVAGADLRVTAVYRRT